MKLLLAMHSLPHPPHPQPLSPTHLTLSLSRPPTSPTAADSYPPLPTRTCDPIPTQPQPNPVPSHIAHAPTHLHRR